MSNIFKQVQHTHVPSNTFDLSHQKAMSLNMGQLYPTCLIECVPGDKITVKQANLIRFAPLVAPVMHQITAYTHFFFVPYRLLWDNWDEFITGGEDGTDTSVFPTLEYGINEDVQGALPDYMGLPALQGTTTQTLSVSAMPFMAYNLIFDEYYRDQNMVKRRTAKKVANRLQDGNNPWTTNNPDDGYNFTNVLRRAWQHDYFTSALPWTQKGPEATIPIGSEAEVNWRFTQFDLYRDNNGAPAGSDNPGQAISVRAGDGSYFAQGVPYETAATLAPIQNLNLDNSENLYADLSGAAAASINDLRKAFRLQEWLEKNARGGSRYTESILVHFGVHSPDQRLQRPEFLGGGKSPVTFSEVLQTSSSGFEGSPTSLTPQGNMAGHGIIAGQQGSVTADVREHGFIMGITSVMPKTGYYQGIPKIFKKFDKFDYYWPTFSNLGEQPIYNYELYADQDDLDNTNGVFGYTPRYSEYKFGCNTVHGDFRGNPAVQGEEDLSYWHMNRYFGEAPSLDANFIQCTPTDRIFAVQGEEQKLYAHIYNEVIANRKMPVFGTPTI